MNSSTDNDDIANIIPFSQDSISLDIDFSSNFGNDNFSNENEINKEEVEEIIEFNPKNKYKSTESTDISVPSDDKEYSEVIDEVFDHIISISFGNNVVSNNDFLILLKKTMTKFVKLIKSQNLSNIGIVDCRSIVDSILGKKEKMTKQRKLEMTPLEKALEEKDNELRLCFDTTFVLLYYKLRPELTVLLWDIEKFKSVYNSLCVNLSDNEIDILLKFRNMIKIAIQIIPAAGNKGFLLDMVTRIVEGHRVKYITGSGAKADTQRRVTIYETEGNVRVAIRPERKKKKDNESNDEIVDVKVTKNKKPKIIKSDEVSEDIQAAHTIALLLSSVGDSQEWNDTMKKLEDESTVFRSHSLL